MEKVSVITHRSAAGRCWMLAATKFLPELLPATNFQENVKKYQPFFFFKKENRLLKDF